MEMTKYIKSVNTPLWFRLSMAFFLAMVPLGACGNGALNNPGVSLMDAFASGIIPALLVSQIPLLFYSETYLHADTWELSRTILLYNKIPIKRYTRKMAAFSSPVAFSLWVRNRREIWYLTILCEDGGSVKLSHAMRKERLQTQYTILDAWLEARYPLYVASQEQEESCGTQDQIDAEDADRRETS